MSPYGVTSVVGSVINVVSSIYLYIFVFPFSVCQQYGQRKIVKNSICLIITVMLLAFTYLNLYLAVKKFKIVYIMQ